MRILIKEDYVDLEAPIQMTDKQAEKFYDFLDKMFPGEVQEVQNVPEATKEVGDRTYNYKDWTPENLLDLLSSDDNDTVADKQGRTRMSVLMRRGYFVPEFMKWAKSNGYALPANAKMIQEFLSWRAK